MGFLWTEFGTLERSFESSDGRYLIIENDQHETRKISLKKYEAAIPRLRDKIAVLTKQAIQIRTSQNTGDWSSSEWFSDISLSNTEVSDSGGITSDETIDELNRKLEEAGERINQERELRMAASDRAEEYQEKYNEAVSEIDELRNAYQTIKSEYEALSQRDKDVAIEQEKILDAKDIVGKTFDFQLKGHAQKLLALRQGIVHRARLDLHILKKVERNVYEVELTRNGNKKCFMALGFDRQTFFIFTVEPAHPKFRRVLSDKLGFNEADLKSSADKYSLEELKSIHDQTMACVN